MVRELRDPSLVPASDSSLAPPTETMAVTGRSFATACAGSAALFIVGAFLLVASDPEWFWDREALYNASVARELLGGQWGLLLKLQYMPFCGGCTVESILAVVSFTLLGTTFSAWKLVPIGFGAGLLVAGADLLRRSEMPAASLAWLGVMAFPPILLGQSMVMGWGNHFEVTALVLACAVVTESLARAEGGPGRWALLGFLFVFTCWFSLTGAVAAPALLLRLAPRIKVELRERRVIVPAAVLGGALLGALPWLLFILADSGDPFEFAISFQTSSGRFTHLGDRLSQLSLLAYAGLWQAPGLGVQTLGSKVAVLTLWGLVLLGLRQARRAPLPVLLLGVYGVVYALSPVEPSSLGQTGLPPPIDQRYLVPWFASLLLCASLGVESLWQRGRWGRGGALIAIGLMVVPGLVARHQWWHSTPEELRIGLNDYLAYDYALLNGVRLAWLPRETLEARDTTDTLAQEESRRAIGQRMAHEFGDLPLDAVSDFAERIRSSGLDVGLITQGIGRELRVANIDLGDMRDSPEHYVERIHTFGALLSSGDRARFYEEIWLGNVALGWSLPEGMVDCGVCPARGAKYVEVPDLSSLPLDDLPSLLSDQIRGATGVERRELLLGAGSTLGVQLGHAPELLAGIGEGLGAEDYALLESAFEKGAALRWRR